MGDTTSKGTHYMTFSHPTVGLTRGDFNVTIIKNNELRTDIAYDIVALSAGLYQLTFENDGDDYTTWTCYVQDPAMPTRLAWETWEVRKKTVEQNIKQVRSRMDSSGGVFNSSLGKE